MSHPRMTLRRKTFARDALDHKPTIGNVVQRLLFGFGLAFLPFRKEGTCLSVGFSRSRLYNTPSFGAITWYTSVNSDL